MNWRVFRAGPRDIELARQTIANVHERSVEDEQTLKLFLGDPSAYFLIAESDGKAIGGLEGRALLHPNRRQPQFLLYKIDVLPEWRRRGVGSALVRQFVEEAKRADAYEIWVLTGTTNAAAVALYSKFGFQCGNSDDAMMNLQLSS